MTEQEELEKFSLSTEDVAALKTVAAKFGALAKARDWDDNMPEVGSKLDRTERAMNIALMHSELSEALEGIRKGKADEHVPEYTSEEVELADTIIRIFHYSHKYGLRVMEAGAAKHVYNMTRPDHKMENRVKDGGKKF